MLRYEQHGPPTSTSSATLDYQLPAERVIVLPRMSLDIAFDDQILSAVKEVWHRIMGEEADAGQFLIFDQREGMGDGDDD
jgi:hypothetical protein